MYLQILKKLTQFFCLFPFANIKKSIFTNPETFFFTDRLFQILKQVYLSILKNLTQFFHLSPVPNFKKEYL